MNRSTALSITFIALNLMACCCGGVGPRAPKPQNIVAGPAKVEPPIEKTAPAKVDPPIEKTAPPSRPIEKTLSEQTRKQIYKAHRVAMEAASKDPRFIELQKQIDKLLPGVARNDKNAIGAMNSLTRESDAIDNAYLKKMVLDPFGVTRTEALSCVIEAAEKKWRTD